MASQREQQQEETHFKVMQLLDENPSISTRKIAQKVGISNGSAYYCVTALVEKGFVKMGNFSRNPRKRQYAYLLTTKGMSEKTRLTKAFIARKRFEYARLLAEIDTLEEELSAEISRSLKRF